MDITFRPRLTKGRHLQTTDQYGPFCLVEALGFNVDGKVDDEHASIDPVLAALARTMNDRMCAHYEHPIAEASGAIATTSDICDNCQARLWAVGERIADTVDNTPDWSEAELARVHVHLALQAARAVLRLIDITDPLHNLAYEAIRAGEACLTADDDTLRGDARLFAAAREAASRLENAVHSGNKPSSWAAHTAAHAARAAAAIAGDKLDDVTMTYFFANRRAREAMSYAIGATAGDPPASMRVARKVLNAFGKATSQKATPGVSDADVIAAGIAADLPAGAVVLYGCEERTTVDGIGYPCVKLGEHVEHTTALGASWWVAAADDGAVQIPTEDEDAGVFATLNGVPMSVPELAEALSPVQAGDDEDVNDFDESELGDVADEAIGDAAALDDDLQRAEAILNAVADLHRPVAAWTRRRPAGFKVDIEYQTDCCVACRDAEGQPIPAPCPTMVALHSFGEA